MKIAKFFALAAFIAFLVFFFLAVFSFPNYSPFENVLSDLGTGEKSALWFNAGVIIAGIFLALFFAAIAKTGLKSRLEKAGALLGILGSISLIAVGVFPASVEPLHSVASLDFFFFSAISALALELPGFKKRKAGFIAALWFALLALAFGLSSLPILEHAAVLFFGAWLVLFAFWKK